MTRTARLTAPLVAALLLAAGVGSAHAFIGPNCISPNGSSPNGLSKNGISPNGLGKNGISPNGLSRNGLTKNGISPNGTEASPGAQVKTIKLPNGSSLSVR